ncbi:MAG TPA: FecR domain-containing protein [Bryobacteraceae bacterium]|nr:FecR domain-containing protein [Bryobacteraceae bacterium]
MTPEYNPMDPALEQAVTEIRDQAVDPALIEAAAARVWARLIEAASEAPAAAHIRTCADFQALIPAYRAGTLPEARSLLLQDHLHQCVACRHVFEGKVVAMPAPAAAPRRSSHMARWAIAATVLVAAGVSVKIIVDQYGARTGRAIVQSVNGTLFEVSADGLKPLAAGLDLPEGVEIRTARDSDAMLQLRDGSLIEMRERSSLTSSPSGGDLTVRLGRGSVIVQAAHRSSGHLYVLTPDSRVAVTGTLFSVIAGVKGSRISVVQGEVHVTQDNQEKVLHPGDQMVTSPTVEPEAIRDDISWSRNRDRLVKQLDSVRLSLSEVQLHGVRYSSRLLARVPASTVFYASIPNLAEYLGEAESVFRQKMADSPQLAAVLAGRELGALAVVEKLRAASEFLGDEVVIVAFQGSDGKTLGPVFLAETKRDGFQEFLKKDGLPLFVETRGSLAVFSPDRNALEAAVPALDSGFPSTPLYARILQEYSEGTGMLVCADLSQPGQQPFAGARYFIAGEKEAGNQMVASATLGFDGPRTGIAAVLASPSPMGSLDYISPDATVLLAFVVNDPVAIVDQVLAVKQGSPKAADRALSDASQQTGFDVRHDLAGSLGGEFALAMDGSVMPVPSWKLVTEVYDPQRFQATLQKVIDSYNRDAVKAGQKPMRTGQETMGDHTYYMVGAANPSPLLEAHYTFDDGYLIAAPTRALVTRALQMKTAGTSIRHSAEFIELTPRDHHLNFSVVIFENIGNTLAPLAALANAFAPKGAVPPNAMQKLANVKPSLYAVYGEPDRITMAANGNVVGSALTDLMSGNLARMTGLPQFLGTHRERTPYPNR